MKGDLMNLKEIVKVVDKEIENKLHKGEKIIFCDSLIKINKKLVEQKRILIITQKALYNFKEKTLKRRLQIKDIFGLTTSKNSEEFVIHGEGGEYDYHYKYQNKRKIIQILAAVYYSEKSRKLNFSLVKDENLHNYVTLINDKKKDKNKSKINNNFLVDIDTYLYGNLMRINTVGKTRNSINCSSVMKAQKTELIFINENSDLIKSLIDIKIENFRVLGSLLKSYYGKMLWCEFIPNSTFYLMRVVNNSDINDFISDIGEIHKLYSNNFISISPAECVIKTEDKVFFLNKFNPYFEGGPLFYHLKNSGSFNEKKTKTISAQIINIILFFHKEKKTQMEFSPENFILDKNGFVNYLWFEINEKLFIDKMKPQVLKPIEYTQIKNDWYNLGVLIYEMLLHVSPLNYMDSYGNIKFPRFIGISNEAKEIIEKLMSMKKETDELKLEDIKRFKFFEDINFDDILKRNFESGIVPMNLEIQKMNNLGTLQDNTGKDMKEEMEKERYTLFNYDSNDEDDYESEQ